MTRPEDDTRSLSPEEKRRLLEKRLRRRAGLDTAELPLSAGQRALWFIQELEPACAAYNVVLAGRLRDPVDITSLEGAFQLLVDRHHGLRATFPLRDGRPVQRIAERLRVPFEVVELGACGEEELVAAVAAETDRPFRLETEPVLRVRLFRRQADAALVAVFHHIAMDGWSLWNTFAELTESYGALQRGERPSPHVSGMTLAEFVSWQSEWVSGPEARAQLEFWRERVAPDAPPLDLTTDFVRPKTKTYNGAAVKFRLEPERVEALERMGRPTGSTIAVYLLTAYQVLLHRYTGQLDFYVGMLAAGRSRERLASVIGYLANPLAFRPAFDARTSFADAVRATREATVEALDRQEYPFPLLVEQLAPERDASRTPIFQALFAFEKPHRLQREGLARFVLGDPGGRLTTEALELETMPFSVQKEGQFDVTLVAAESDGGVSLSLDYNTDLFRESTIRRMAAHLVQLLEQASENPRTAVSELPILTLPELEALRRWNDTKRDFADTPLPDRIREHARRDSGASAVEMAGQVMSYAELDERSDALARHLVDSGVGPGDLVGLCMERCLDLIVGMIAISKSGAAFVPLDPSYPAERIRFMMEDADVRTLVSQQALVEELDFFDGRAIAVDRDRRVIERRESATELPRVGPGDLAYVIYTSGSTGRPKGVPIEHRGLSNVSGEQQRRFGVGPGSRVLQFASLSFDAAVFEVVMALGSGGTLCLGSRVELLPGEPLAEFLARERIEVVTLPPSALMNVPETDLPALRTITVAGEACPSELSARWAREGRRFFNLYGPTETTIWATVAELTGEEATPSIGEPIANTRVHVLDPQLQEVPVGVAGELCIAGVGVARGYLGRDELTASRFVDDPFGGGGRLYRTGDRVRRLEDGSLDFLGRMDFQVKVRGYRIEPGEIENELARHPDVNEVAVVARRDAVDQHRLLAYLVPRIGASPSEAELRDHLRARLPEFMIPSSIIALDSFPTSPSGKIDRNALPDPETVRSADRHYVAPSNRTEAVIASVWKELLGLQEVGVDENFFDLGGNSLLIARVKSRLSEALGRDVSIIDLFNHPTVTSLARRYSSDAEETVAPAPSRDKLDGAAERRALLRQRRSRGRR